MKRTITIALFVLVAGFAPRGSCAQTVVSEDCAVDVSVLSAWTLTPLYAVAGDTLFIYARGVVGPGADSVDWREWSGPDGGYPVQGGCTDCPLPGYPPRCLIGRIGDGDPFFIGSFAAVTVSFSGVLHIGINETDIGENAGSIRAFVWRRGNTVTAVEGPSAPSTPFIRLYQSVPNPFNAVTMIRFHLARPMRATLDIYDVNGRRVIRLFDGEQPCGEGSVVWRGHNEQGNRVASGVYFYRLRAGDRTATRKMVLVR